MISAIHRRNVLRVGAAIGVSWLLPPVGAHEVTTSTLRVVHPWSRATAADATEAVLCMRFDDVTIDDRLVSVESPVAAGAAMGGGADADAAGAGPAVDFFIPEGRTTELVENGHHVRLLGLKFPLEVGTSHPVQLGFEKGGVYLTTFTVDFTRFD